MKLHIPALAALVAASTLSAQDEPLEDYEFTDFIDVLSTRVVHTSGMEFNGLTRGEADFTTASMFAIAGNAEFAPDWRWIPAVGYQFSRLDLEARPFGANPAAPPLDHGLHQLTLHQFFINTPSDSRWINAAYLAGSVNSDFSRVGTRDINLIAAVGTGYRFSNHFTGGVGVYGSNLLNEPFIVPAPVFVWTPTDEWLVSYYGPRFVARRTLGDDIRVGFEAAWNGGWWGVDAFGADTRLQVTSARAGFYYRQRLAGDLWIEAGAGYTFANEIKLRSHGGRDLFPAALGDADPAPYFSLGLSLHRW